MSEFIHMAPCPSCGSRDNLGVYTDHVFCFGCRYYDSQLYGPVIRRVKKEAPDDPVYLPRDYSRNIGVDGLSWLDKYGITQSDILTHHIGWSDAGVLMADGSLFAPCLIFPVYDLYGNLLMWQGRYFGKEEKWLRRKYYTRGGKATLHVIGKGGNICIVEDMLSAIKISHVNQSLPLFGSGINLSFLMRLHRVTDSFNFWLDADKYKDAQRFKERAKQFFKHVGVISTPLDPKEYTYSEIRTILGHA